MRFEEDRLADLALCVRHPLCLRPDPIDRPGVGTSPRMTPAILRRCP
jgi:hypothetical protein